MRTVQIGPASGALGIAILLTVIALGPGLGRAGWIAGLVYAVALWVLLGSGLARSGAARLGPANGVTLVRAVLVGAVTAQVVDGFGGPIQPPWLLLPVTVALVLDGVDGQVARRTGTVSPLGARFDMEIDAFLILVLSVHAGSELGWWVLAIGVAYYAHLAVGRLVPWLGARVPPRYWRKPVAATQGIALGLAAGDLLGSPWIDVVVAGALVLLAESFGRDDLWLWRRHRRLRAGLSGEPELVWIHRRA